MILRYNKDLWDVYLLQAIYEEETKTKAEERLPVPVDEEEEKEPSIVDSEEEY